MRSTSNQTGPDDDISDGRSTRSAVDSYHEWLRLIVATETPEEMARSFETLATRLEAVPSASSTPNPVIYLATSARFMAENLRGKKSSEAVRVLRSYLSSIEEEQSLTDRAGRPPVMFGANGETIVLTDTNGASPDMDSATVIMHASALLLRRARQNRGLTLEELADACFVSPSVLCRIELARREPRLRVVLSLCNLLGVRFSDVLRMAEEEAFPLGRNPWTDRPEDLIGHDARSLALDPAPTDTGTEVVEDSA
jgi:transcriptional regulator with XRE-family HTH domain